MKNRRPVATGKAPSAVGPYSQGIVAGHFLFTAGQIPLDPTSGRPAGGGVGAETERALENLRAVLEAGGSGLDRVVKTTVYLTDLSRFDEMNEAYRLFFPDPAPARSCVEVRALPKGVSVEIEAVALAGL